jgi:Pathogenicity locus
MPLTRKVKKPSEAVMFTQLPNIGVELAEDFKVLGITKPSQLKGKDPYDLYAKLCEKTMTYHDPCVLDTFISAIHFMDGKGAKSWWDFTVTRKKNFGRVADRIAIVRARSNKRR